jgi:hypothetical protein
MKFKGEPAGFVKDGYVRVKIDGFRYFAHLVIWLMETGEWRPYGVDHADTDGCNNRWTNLRASTTSQNAANRRCQSNNRTGLKGVHLSTRDGGFTSEIVVSGKRTYLGSFDCPAAAHFAYTIAAHKGFGDFARLK